jgi:tripartite-type tricarboxylate transporter receptor subunit TctC
MTRTPHRTAAALTALAAGSALLAGCTSSAAAPGGASDATFPESGQTIEWIVPSAAGAGNDILARILAPVLSEELDANVKVVNKEGGSQVIGLNYLASAAKDGGTIGFTNIPSIFGRYLDPSKQAGFDRESFAPIGSFALNDVVIGVNASSPYTSLEELFDAVEAAPGEITVGTDSRAGDDHVNLRTIEKELGLDFNIVHYNSGADKIAALVSGEVDFALGGVSSFIGQYKSGEISILAVVNDQQSPFLPDVPTIADAGFELEPMTNNFAISAPAGTPEETIAALEGALEAATQDPEVAEKLEAAGTVPTWEDAAEVAALWEEREKTAKPVIEELIAE